jgi:hypothetical protein
VFRWVAGRRLTSHWQVSPSGLAFCVAERLQPGLSQSAAPLLWRRLAVRHPYKAHLSCAQESDPIQPPPFSLDLVCMAVEETLSPDLKRRSGPLKRRGVPLRGVGDVPTDCDRPELGCLPTPPNEPLRLLSLPCYMRLQLFRKEN